MNIRNLSFGALALGLCISTAAHAAEPTRFHLDLNRPPPKIGAETERTIQISSTTSNTTWSQRKESSTNGFQFFELVDREKVLNWDVGDDSAKIALVVNRFIDGYDHQTNELVKAGTQLVATALYGGKFFESKGEPLSTDAYQHLDQSYRIRPRDFNELSQFQIPPSLSVGESWTMAAPSNVEELIRVLGPSYTDSVKATGQFVGTTNLFGFDCFHLRFRIITTELPEAVRQAMTARLPVSVKGQIEVTIDLIAPFDTSQRILREAFATDFSDSSEMVLDGKQVMSSRGQSHLEFACEYRPIK